MGYPQNPPQPGQWPQQGPPQQGPYGAQPGQQFPGQAGPPPQQGYGPPQGQWGAPAQAGPPAAAQGWGDGPPQPDLDRLYENSKETGGDYAAGTWPFTVTEAAYGPTAKGDKWMWRAKLQLGGGPDAGRVITAYLVLVEDNDGLMFRTFSWLQALGVPVGEKFGDQPGTVPYWRQGWTGDQVAQAITGRGGMATIKNDDRGGKVDKIAAPAAGGYPAAPAPQGYAQGPPQGPPPGPPQQGPPAPQQQAWGQSPQPYGPPAQQGPPQGGYAPQGPPPPQQQAGPPQQAPWPGNGQPQQAAAPQAGQQQGGPGPAPWRQ